MATFGSFAGLAAGAMGVLSSTELQLLRLCDFPAVSASQKTSSESHRHGGSRQQDSNDSARSPTQRNGLLSRFSVVKLVPEFNGIGCFDTVFGWQSS